MCDGASFWKNFLPFDPVGPADHREGALLEVGHEHGRDRPVVLEQVAFRDPLCRKEDLVEIRELQLARRPS